MLKRTQIYGRRWKIHGRYIGAATRAVKVITTLLFFLSRLDIYYLSITVNSITVANLLNRFPPIAIVRKTFPSI